MAPIGNQVNTQVAHEIERDVAAFARSPNGGLIIAASRRRGDRMNGGMSANGT